jgi:hypothetical protein
MADEPDVDIKFGASTEGIEEGAERSKEALDSLKEKLNELKESGEKIHGAGILCRREMTDDRREMSALKVRDQSKIQAIIYAKQGEVCGGQAGVKRRRPRETVVTSEMRLAGAAILSDPDVSFSHEEMAEAVYIAMTESLLSSHDVQSSSPQHPSSQMRGGTK